MFLLASGHSSQDIDNMHFSDARLVWDALRSGLYGPLRDFTIAYTNNVYLHNLTQLTEVGKVKGKKKLDTPPAFKDVYPHINEVITLGKIEENHERSAAEQLITALPGATDRARDMI